MRGSHLVLVVLAVGSTARAEPSIKPKSGAALCGALAPSDFKAAGVQNADKPKPNVQDGGASAYCVYAGKSSATGGIELDVFHPAGANVKEAKATLDTAIGEVSSSLKPLKVAGADDAQWSAKAVSGGAPFAVIAVRRATLVFVIGIPTSTDAEPQLRKLADLVLKRL